MKLCLPCPQAPVCCSRHATSCLQCSIYWTNSKSVPSFPWLTFSFHLLFSYLGLLSIHGLRIPFFKFRVCVFSSSFQQPNFHDLHFSQWHLWFAQILSLDQLSIALTCEKQGFGLMMLDFVLHNYIFMKLTISTCQAFSLFSTLILAIQVAAVLLHPSETDQRHRPNIMA